MLGSVFRLDAAAIRGWLGMTGPLPAGALRMPATIPAGMQARLLTKIVAFGPHRLDDWDSSLNLPQHFPGRPDLRGGETLRFAYDVGERPGLVLA